ncbi:MAG: DUF3341 domain-containing protein [Rhodanobacter sp.]
MSDTRLYGLLAEFADPGQLRAAALRARHQAHYTRLDAYSPFPVDGLAEALDKPRVHVPLWTLIGAIFGGGSTFLLEWYSAVIDYPINVGGRPTFSWPAFIPASLEMTILWAAVFGVAAMLLGNGLPRLHHPLFAMPAFDRASNDRFFLLVRAEDPRFDLRACREFLAALDPLSISEVPS